ncbi:uncharacterized protein METZ01_LOCUS44674, partial [marine metagenome]
MPHARLLNGHSATGGKLLQGYAYAVVHL